MQSVMPGAVSAIAAAVAGEAVPETGARVVDLRGVWAQVTDPRDRRGRRHSLGVILTLVQAAVVGGATAMTLTSSVMSADIPQLRLVRT